MSETSHIPFREVPYLPQKLVIEQRGEAVYLSNGQPLKDYPAHMLVPFKHWASVAPDRVWLAQRDPVDSTKEGWQTLTYGEAWQRIQAIAAGFLEHGGGPEAPVMILSRNAIDHALVMYGAMLAGSPVVPVTPAYALLSQDFARLNYVDGLIGPKFIYVEDGQEYQRGLEGMSVGDRLVIYSRRAPTGYKSVSLDAFGAALGDAVDTAYAQLQPDTVAKYMLTSGSTGEPKAVINTHEMIAANAKMIRSVWDEARLTELSGGHQVMCNFLPWSHTYGANAILHNMTDWGGTLYIDWGAPTPARLPEMLRNLREVSTTQHTTVPAAWAALATEFEKDDVLAQTFFKRICSMAYGGAAMGQDIYERIQKVAVRLTGERISLSAGYGATETAPTASNVHWPNDTMGLIGLPLPGNVFKLVPNGEKQELRVKGVNVTPGYYRNAEKTREAFDEEGFYKLGDAVRFVEPDNPNKGLAFDGRTAEEFKLANGTWVSAGKLRVQVVQAVDGALSDVVVCGLNRDDIRLLGFLNEGYCQRLVGENLSLSDLVTNQTVRESVEAGIAKHNAANPNAAARIGAILLQDTPPQADAGEITEKGYINQNKAQSLRAGAVTSLYEATLTSDKICI
ncbi:feruloyl-CoA synthase [Hyphomonas sp. FCG-A18]|uniref:feruloyl-CoA synthase n=1 Tax=Hyphomonas sp. FCG-A18 TaxID=3080019 RepID=UPI002B28125D|nr:feruloyl-CoA synthase [Hyphomonas sp. FCG-A18]